LQSSARAPHQAPARPRHEAAAAVAPALTDQPPAQPAEEKPNPQATREGQLTLLEIDPAAPLSADLIRRQYHLLSERYDSAKFEAAGPEFVAMAQSKREALRAAATALLGPLGEKLEVAPPAAESRDLRHNPDLDALFGD
jgi:hypothetical protein